MSTRLIRCKERFFRRHSYGMIRGPPALMAVRLPRPGVVGRPGRSTGDPFPDLMEGASRRFSAGMLATDVAQAGL